MTRTLNLILATAVIGISALTPATAVEPSLNHRIEARIQHLEDREAIAQLIVDYGHSFDLKDWALHRSIFTEEIEMDFSASIGDGLVRMRADDWVTGVRPFFEALDATQHLGMPLSITIEGDQAMAVTMLHAQHFDRDAIGGPVQRMIGRYDMRFVRLAEGWKIAGIVQHIDWHEGNWHVFLKAAGLAE